MPASALPHLVARVLRAPLSALVVLSLILLSGAISVLAPPRSSTSSGSGSTLLYDLAFLDAALLGTAVLAVSSGWERLLDRLSPASRLATEAVLLAASTWILLSLTLLLQQPFLPLGGGPFRVSAESWRPVLSVAAGGVLLLRLRLAPGSRALLLLGAVWVLPAVVGGSRALLPGGPRIPYGAESPLTIAPILGCLLAAWLCLTRAPAHR